MIDIEIKCCPKHVHDAIKLDDARWFALPLSRKPYGPTYADPGEPQWVEQRDCTACNSSLMREIDALPAGVDFEDEPPTVPAAYVTVHDEYFAGREVQP